MPRSQHKFTAPTGAYWLFGEGTHYPEGDFYSHSLHGAKRASLTLEYLRIVASEDGSSLIESYINCDPDLDIDEGL